MNRRIALVSLCLLLPIAAAAAQGLSALDILNKADDAVNGAKDQTCTMSIVLIDKSGAQKTRELQMLQKGRDKRVAKFLSPADQRGISFLSLPDDVQYVYLPAYGKARRIATYVKNTSFAGTDFTYEDMEAVRQSDRWIPVIQSQDQDTVVLSLTPKQGFTSDYSKLVMTIRLDNWMPTRVEHYDKAGKLFKIMTREKIQQIQGYWVAMETTMEDVKKQHTTKMIITDVKFDTGIPDDRFTERYLSQ